MYLKDRSLEYFGHPKVRALLESTGSIHTANAIPMKNARWHDSSSYLALDMVTQPVNEGHPGICHGGFIAMLVDSLGATAGFIWAAEQGRTVLTEQMRKVEYFRPLRIKTAIHVGASLKRVNDDQLEATVNISKILDRKPIARGHLLLQIVNGIR